MRSEEGFIQGPQLVILAICLVVIAIGGAILLVDKYIVQPRRPPVDVEGHLAGFGFESVPERERVEQARRLLRDVPGFLDEDLEERGVQRMVRRSDDRGTVWAFELTIDGEWAIRNGRTLQRHEASVEVLQPVIVVEQPAVEQGRWVVAPGQVPEELRAGLRPVRLPVEGMAGGMSEERPFPGLARVDALERMRSWGDVWFAGAGQRTAFFWPPPRASMIYWSRRSTSDELVPSLANGGFEWDLQRAVDIAGMLHPDAPQLSKVVGIDVEVPEIEVPKLDLSGVFEEAQERVAEGTAEAMEDFEASMEEFRAETARQSEEFRARSAANREEFESKMEKMREESRQRSEELRRQREADRAARRAESERRLEESRRRSEQLLEELEASRQRSDEALEEIRQRAEAASSSTAPKDPPN